MAISNIDLSAWLGKSNGSTLSATEWNNLFSTIQTKINALVSSANGNISTSGDFYVNGTKATPINGVINLVSQATYVFSGVLNGKVVIGNENEVTQKAYNQMTAEEKVGKTVITNDTHVILDGVTIVENGALANGIFYASESQTMYVTLAKNKVNTVVCSYTQAIADNQGACIRSAQNMVVQGCGYLVLKNNGGHGLRGADLRISGRPHIYSETSHDGIHGGNTVYIDGGHFYFAKANDAVGTGTNGKIKVFGGHFEAHNIHQNVFDSKADGYFFGNAYSIRTDALNVSVNMTRTDPKVKFGGAVQDNSNGGYSTQPSGAVYCYDDEGMETGESVVTPTNGIYTLTTKYAKVEGYVEGVIKATIQSTDISLNGAYIKGSIQYTPTKKKLQITAEKDTENFIVSDTETDAVNSASNISVEFKNGAYLCVTSGGNGIIGDEVTLNDSKGVLLIRDCGKYGICGKDIYIGCNADYIKYLGGAQGDGGAGAELFLNGAVVVEGSGISDLYAIFNSKFVKGDIHCLDAQIKGVVIADNVRSNGTIYFDNSKRIFYKTVSFGVAKGDSGKTYEPIDIVKYNEAVVYPLS